MTVSKRLVALALLVASYTLFVWVPLSPAQAAEGCRLMEDEMAEAASAGFAPIKDYQAAEAKAFMVVVNKIAPSPIDADQVRVFARPDVSKVMLVFMKGGCFVLRAAIPILLYKQMDNDAQRSLAKGGQGS